MNPRSVGIFAIAVALIVGGAIYFLNSEYAPHATPAPKVVEAPTPEPKAYSPTPRPATTREVPTPGTGTVTAPPTPMPDPSPVTLTEDDRKIDEILRQPSNNTDADNANMAQKLINILPTMKPEGQSEAINHVTNLLSDDEFKRVIPIWKNPSYSAEVLDVIMTDLMNRDDKIKLPALLDAVRIPNHPSREEAMSTLQVFLDEDYGEDTSKWEKGVADYLKKLAAEEAGNPPPN